MKNLVTKFLLTILTILLLSTSALFAATVPMTVKLLDAVTSTGPGAVFPNRLGMSLWTCDIDITGSPTAVTVRINGNLGGDKWSPDGMAEIVLDAAELTAEFATKVIPESAVLQLRANVVVLTGGTSPTVTTTCLGADR